MCQQFPGVPGGDYWIKDYQLTVWQNLQYHGRCHCHDHRQFVKILEIIGKPSPSPSASGLLCRPCPQLPYSMFLARTYGMKTFGSMINLSPGSNYQFCTVPVPGYQQVTAESITINLLSGSNYSMFLAGIECGSVTPEAGIYSIKLSVLQVVAWLLFIAQIQHKFVYVGSGRQKWGSGVRAYLTQRPVWVPGDVHTCLEREKKVYDALFK